MTRSRRMVLQGAFVFFGGVVTLFSPRRASATVARFNGCQPTCYNDCNTPPPGMDCDECGAQLQCMVADCGGQVNSGFWYCAAAS